jgi:hypothetical protein
MPNAATLRVSAVIGVCVYYLLAWAVSRRNSKKGPVVPLYSPPEDLSPAMLRYAWREKFDDRTFWAGVLSLVAKGLATLESKDNEPVLRPTASVSHPSGLPPEEIVLATGLLSGHHRKGLPITMLDPQTALTASKMADLLRRAAIGRWFSDNREFVIAGIVVSAVAVCIVASPSTLTDWVVLVLGMAVMAPAAFYLVFLLLRIGDLLRAACHKFDTALLSRTALLLTFAVPCVAGLVLGSVVLSVNFGWQVMAVAASFTALNLVFLHFMRTPTLEGRRLLDEIEGFRLFLTAVDKFPMDRSDAPNQHAGLYEKYLPYAVGLEVEQSWSDRFVALASTHHECEVAPGYSSFYLGMWNGKPVEIDIAPPNRGGKF